MKTSKGNKESARSRILAAAERGFRKKGYGGLGIDGLAKDAGVTSGAFYGHFKSKDEVFKETTIQGMINYRDSVNRMQTEHGVRWLNVLLDYYLSEAHIYDLDSSCAVPSLSTDVMRADLEIKMEYEFLLKQIAKSIAHGLPQKSIRNAFALMALLSGIVTMARAVNDKKCALLIAKSGRKMAEQLIKIDKKL
jgi:TetR/AcrR family transcriptional regulator, transcriptional repressor for nem operon